MPDPTPTFMFTHVDAQLDEPAESEADLCATTKVTKEVQLEALKKHLKALTKFPQGDLIAALEDEVMEQASGEGAESSDDDGEEDEDAASQAS